MKKLSLIMMVIIAMLTVAACGRTANTNTELDSIHIPTQEVTQTPEPTPEPTPIQTPESDNIVVLEEGKPWTEELKAGPLSEVNLYNTESLARYIWAEDGATPEDWFLVGYLKDDERIVQDIKRTIEEYLSVECNYSYETFDPERGFYLFTQNYIDFKKSSSAFNDYTKWVADNEMIMETSGVNKYEEFILYDGGKKAFVSYEIDLHGTGKDINEVQSSKETMRLFMTNNAWKIDGFPEEQLKRLDLESVNSLEAN